MKRDYLLEVKIANFVFKNMDIEMYDSGFGYIPYFTDKNKTNSSSTSLVGGVWQTVLDQDGKIITAWIKPVPAWSVDLRDAWNLLIEYMLIVDEKIKILIFSEMIENGLMKSFADKAAHIICKAIEKILI